RGTARRARPRLAAVARGAGYARGSPRADRCSRFEPLRMAEHAQLGDVAAKEERRRPVGDDPQLPSEQWQLVEVIRPRDEPAGKPAEEGSGDLRDALVAAERRHLTEHAVPIRLRLARQVLRESPRLAQRVLA